MDTPGTADVPLFPTGNVSLAGNNVVNLFSVSPNFGRVRLSFNLNVEKGWARMSFCRWDTWARWAGGC